MIDGAKDWKLDQWDDERGVELVTDVDVERDRIADGIERSTLAKVIKGELDAILVAHKMYVTAAAREDYEEALAHAHLRALAVIERRASGENVVGLDGLLKHTASTMPKTHRPYPPEFRQRIVELVRKGRTPEELGQQFELSA